MKTTPKNYSLASIKIAALADSPEIVLAASTAAETSVKNSAGRAVVVRDCDCWIGCKLKFYKNCLPKGQNLPFETV